MNTPPGNYADTMMEQLAAHKASRSEQSRLLWAMSPAEREAAMWRGELTNAQLWEWARRRPNEIPLINNEWAFIALHTPEVAEVNEPTAPAKPIAPVDPCPRPDRPAPRRGRRNDEPEFDLSH